MDAKITEQMLKNYNRIEKEYLTMQQVIYERLNMILKSDGLNDKAARLIFDFETDSFTIFTEKNMLEPITYPVGLFTCPESELSKQLVLWHKAVVQEKYRQKIEQTKREIEEKEKELKRKETERKELEELARLKAKYEGKL
jgi:hypothetical protein